MGILYNIIDNSYKLLYAVIYREKVHTKRVCPQIGMLTDSVHKEEVYMMIIINSSSMVPIYEQIMDQIKTLIRKGELKENDILPSVRGLSKELKISALTVKKAYDNLESEGFIVTVHGKGSYVAETNTELLLEEQRKELESDLDKAIQKGRRYGISDEDIRELFELILEG